MRNRQSDEERCVGMSGDRWKAEDSFHICSFLYRQFNK